MKVDEASLEQTSWTNERQVEERQGMSEAISNSLGGWNAHFQKFTEVKDTPKRNSSTIIKVDNLFSKYATCGWGVADNDSCSKYKHPLHFDCGFKFKDQENVFVLWGNCGKGKKDWLWTPWKMQNNAVDGYHLKKKGKQISRFRRST